jgi:hypothetical protein
MYKTCLLLLLVLPSALHAESSASSTSSAPLFSEGGAVIPQPETSQGFFDKGILAPTVHDAPVGAFTGSFVYQYSPNADGANRSLMGWSAVPEINLTKHIGLQAEFAGLYMRGVYPGQSRLMIAAGPRITLLPHSRLSPFLFGEAGEIRSTNQANDVSDWDPVAAGGFGFGYKLTRGLSLQLVPGEYVGQLQYDGSWSHSFTSSVGITFNLYR